MTIRTMHRISGTLPAFLLGFALQAASGVAQDTLASPAERHRALLREYQSESGGFRKAATDAERKAAVERLPRFARGFLELAEAHPADPIALDAILEFVRVANSVDSLTQSAWEMNQSEFPEADQEDLAGRATALLLRNHVLSEKLGLICQRMSYGVRGAYESFLRTVLRTNPHKDVQGLACLALAQFLNSRLQKLDIAGSRPEWIPRIERLLGKECFEKLRRQDRSSAGAEAEVLFEKAAGEYGDVQIPFGGSVGDRARSELFELRDLAVGRVAPDIEAEDQDGKQFKLSDYRGRVVLLDFWQEF